MEDLSIEVGKVSHHEDEDGFNDPNLVGEAGDEAGEKTPGNADHSATYRHYEERGYTGQYIRV